MKFSTRSRTMRIHAAGAVDVRAGGNETALLGAAARAPCQTGAGDPVDPTLVEALA